MSSKFIMSLGLKTRIAGALNEHGVDTLMKFMALTEAEVRGWEQIGSSSWQEIERVQSHFHKLSGEPDLPTMVKEINRQLAHKKWLMMKLTDEGFLVLFQRIS